MLQERGVFNPGGFHPSRNDADKVGNVLTSDRMEASEIAKRAGLTRAKTVMCLQALTRAGVVRYAINPRKQTTYVYWKGATAESETKES